MDFFTNCKPADWKTGFEPRVSVESTMPYEEYARPLEVSGNDKRQYRLVRLPNNLIALCVQDSESEVASASLSVGVGSNVNSAQLLGLAHFLEHMLFMGTEKYPKEGEYHEYIANNSGKANAYTSFEETNYYFSVVNGAFEGALDRFAQFFISPLFSADCVDRELMAVDSEYKNKLQDDDRRFYRVMADTSNPAHPYSKFTTGNTQTLRDAANALGLNLRDEMIKLYNKYYSADNMRLVVVGSHSLDELTEWAASKFSAVISKGNITPRFGCHLLSSAEIGKVIRYKTVGEKFNLELEFSIPEIKSTYRSKPFGYISSLLAHKGPGSIFSMLRKNGWATSLFASSNSGCDDGFTIYRIGVTATPKGLEEYQAIVGLIFAYVKMLKEQGPQEWYFQELAIVKKAKYDYKARENVQSYARNVASDAHNEYVLPNHLLSQDELLGNYDAELISACLGFINPQNYRLYIGAQEH
ncbi:metalloprotease, partial [Coemansia thaxteri]